MKIDYLQEKLQLKSKYTHAEELTRKRKRWNLPALAVGMQMVELL
jgi:hypothetical protein